MLLGFNLQEGAALEDAQSEAELNGWGVEGVKVRTEREPNIQELISGAPTASASLGCPAREEAGAAIGQRLASLRRHLPQAPHLPSAAKGAGGAGDHNFLFCQVIKIKENLAHREDVPALDYNVVHVDSGQSGEVPGEGDEVIGMGTLVILDEFRWHAGRETGDVPREGDEVIVIGTPVVLDEFRRHLGVDQQQLGPTTTERETGEVPGEGDEIIVIGTPMVLDGFRWHLGVDQQLLGLTTTERETGEVPSEGDEVIVIETPVVLDEFRRHLGVNQQLLGPTTTEGGRELGKQRSVANVGLHENNNTHARSINEKVEQSRGDLRRAEEAIDERG
ncbi:hypothetical protein ZIOFF_031520 [Zingiber officinale]|uniref:Uncharacterized protein n=1 Tax=Zingiber officinale TaxID=94328 RepID=A0A8J5GGQ7_ZINOF|nr:hypothetical protein ZIOFF_031520 [Zingiber officinale]